MEKKNNPADWLKQGVRALFLIFTLWILGLSLGTIQLKESMEAFGKGPWLTILLVGGSLTLFLVFWLFTKIRLLQEEKYAGMFILFCIAMIGILQILCIFKLRIRFRYDALEVYEEACRLLKTGQITNWDYFGANPHQRGTLYITWFLLKIAASLHIPESMYMVYLDLWCMICVDSCILGAGFVVGREKGLRVMTMYFFMMLLQPFTYMWCLFHYTTVQCLPFMMFMLLLTGAVPQCRKMKQKIILGIVMGVVCFIGNKIRPTVLIALIAYVLYVGLQWLREWFRKYQMPKETKARTEEAVTADADEEPEETDDGPEPAGNGRKKTEGLKKNHIRKVIRPEAVLTQEEPEETAEAALTEEPEEEAEAVLTQEEPEEEAEAVLTQEEPEGEAEAVPTQEEPEGEAEAVPTQEEPEEETEAVTTEETEKDSAGQSRENAEETETGTEERKAAEETEARTENRRKNTKKSGKNRKRKEENTGRTAQEPETEENAKKTQTAGDTKDVTETPEETDGQPARNGNRQKQKGRSAKKPRAPKTDTLERMEKILNETDEVLPGNASGSEKKKKHKPKVMSASRKNRTARKTERFKETQELATDEEALEATDIELTVDAKELEENFKEDFEGNGPVEESEEAEYEAEEESEEAEYEAEEESEEAEYEAEEESEEAEYEAEEEVEEAEYEAEEEVEEAEYEAEEESEEAESAPEKEAKKQRTERRRCREEAPKKERERFLGNLAAVAAFVLTFLLLGAAYKALDHKMVTVDTGSYERPLLFWVAMSAKGDGTWDGNDAEQLARYETKEEKEAYTKELLSDRLGNLSAGEWLGLMSGKLKVTWAKGNDDAISENTDSLVYGKWYDRLLGEESLLYLYYCQIFRVLMFACIAFGTVCAFQKRSVQSSDYMRIVILGGILFHLLWEAKPLYSLPFMPFLTVLMTEGLWQILTALGADTHKDRWQSRRRKDRTVYPVIVLSGLAWLCLMIWGFGYGPKLLKQERTIRSYTASQAMERCDIKRGLLEGEAVRQEFMADKTFNTIGVQTRNYSWYYGKQNDSLYRLTLFDSEDQVLRQAMISGSEFEDYEYCDVSFEPVEPEKSGELYRFLIETVSADDSSYLVFYKKASDAIDPYPWGEYVENGVPMEQADLTFRVCQKEYGPVMTKKGLILLVFGQVLLQMCALLLCLPQKEETVIRSGRRKRRGF